MLLSGSMWLWVLSLSLVPESNVQSTSLTAKLLLEGAIHLETDRVDPNETLRVSGVVVHGFPSSLYVHACKIGRVQGFCTFPSKNRDVALPELQLDGALDVLLGEVHGVTDEVHLGSEPKAIVAEAGELQSERLGNPLDLTIHGDALEVKVSSAEKGSPGGLVDSARLDPDEAVLDDVDTTTSISSCDLVGVEEELQRIRDSLVVRKGGHLDGNTGLEVDANFISFVGCLLGVRGHLEHGLVGGHCSILGNEGRSSSSVHREG